MSEHAPYQLHVEPDHIYYGSHPDPAVNAESERLLKAGDEHVLQFQESVDTANRNAEYDPLLSQVTRVFERDGMDHVPIVVLSPEQFDITRAMYDPYYAPDTPVHGIQLMGRCLIRELDAGSDLSKQMYVLGTALHEAAHSAGYEERSGVVSLANPELPDDASKRWYGHVPSHENFNSYDFAKVRLQKIDGKYEPSKVGDFFEEGFAEYTSVRYMREILQSLGMQTPVPDQPVLLPSYHIRLVDPNNPSTTPAPEGYIDMPSDYADNVHESSDTVPTNLTLTTSALAAYSIELLERRAPGLYHQMQQSRRDPAAYHNVIRMIDGIQPGLYRRLRNSRGSIIDNLVEVHRIYNDFGPGRQSGPVHTSEAVVSTGS